MLSSIRRFAGLTGLRKTDRRKQYGITENAKAYYEKMFPDDKSKLLETDTEFAERFADFAFDEVVNQDDLDGRTRFMAILAWVSGGGCISDNASRGA